MSAKEIPLSSKGLWRLLDYNPETGALTWKPRGVDSRTGRTWDSRYAGKEAGTRLVQAKGGAPHQIRVLLDAKRYGAHRLIWKMMTGQEPPRFIDHKNGDPWDNRWDNLVEGTAGDNQRNRAPISPDRPPGVHYVKSRGRWAVYGVARGTRRTIGWFKPEDFDLACMEAMEFRVEQGYSKRHWSPWQGGN